MKIARSLISSRKHLYKLIRLTGLPLIFREVIQKNRITILLFHDINKATAKRTFDFLSSHYNIVSLDEVVEAIAKRDMTMIPKKALVITFDDGRFGNYEVLEVAKSSHIPITIFLCASIIGTNRRFWWKYGDRSIDNEELKNVSNEERLKILSEHGFEQEKEFDDQQALQEWQIDEMKPYIDLQSHTLFHPCLPKCVYDEARKEILGSKELLERKYGLKVNAIAFPNGSYSERDITLAKEAGYRCALTVDFGFNDARSDVYRLKRIGVNDTDDLNELIVKSSGVWSFFKTRNGRRNGPEEPIDGKSL